MTTEGRPEFKNSEEFYAKTYAEQRKCRLQDAIDDYLQDDSVSVTQFYMELKDCFDDVIKYHTKSRDRATAALQLCMGHRPSVDLGDVTQEDVTRALNNMPTRY